MNPIPDLEHGKLTVDQTLKRSGPQVAFGKPKTPQSRRTITLPAEVVDGLRQIRRWRIEQKLRLGPKFRDYGLVFCLPNGKPPIRTTSAKETSTQGSCDWDYRKYDLTTFGTHTAHISPPLALTPGRSPIVSVIVPPPSRCRSTCMESVRPSAGPQRLVAVW